MKRGDGGGACQNLQGALSVVTAPHDVLCYTGDAEWKLAKHGSVIP